MRMDKITPLTDQRAIEAEACAWIAQFDGNDPSPEDLKAFREWIGRSPCHREAMQRLSGLWGDLNLLTELAVPPQPSSKAPDQSKTKPHRRPQPGGLPIFAGVLATLILVTAGLLFLRQHSLPAVTETPLFYATALGERKTINLPDGSTVQLNTASQIKVDYSHEARQLRLLRGEAYFDVAPNPDRPFMVYAGANIVRAVGTAFTVQVKQQTVEVVVTEGTVELAAVPKLPDTKTAVVASTPATRLATLPSGHRAVIDRKVEVLLPIEHEEITRRLSWREGMLVFSGEPLEQVIEEISRYAPITIEITDPQIRQLRIGGYFKVGETNAMFEALEKSFGVQVSRLDDQHVRLSAAQ
jgi:transmembrane sensor